MSLLIPRARIGLSRHFGAMFDAERRNGLEIIAMGDQVVMHIWKDGVKFYTVEAPPQRAQQIAELLTSSDAAGSRKANYFTPLTPITKENVNRRNCWTMEDLQ